MGIALKTHNETQEHASPSRMCATLVTSETTEAVSFSFETLLVRLVTESHGLNPRELFQLFRREAEEFFGASTVCCCAFSNRDEAIVKEANGCQPWMALGDMFPSNAMSCKLARSAERAIPCGTALNEISLPHEDTEHERVTIPLLGQSGLRGSAVLVWPGQVNSLNEVALRQLTHLGTVFAGLLDHARLFERVYRSREKWLQVVDTIPDSIVVHDANANIIRINRSLADRIGSHPSQLIGRPIREVLKLAGREDSTPCPLCPGKPEGVEGPVELFSGCSFLVSTTKMAQDREPGANTVHVLVNISDQLEAERRYHDLFDSIQEGAFFCDPDGRILGANPALAHMLGYSNVEELLEFNLFEDLFLHDAEKVHLLKGLSRWKSLRNHEAALRRKSGRALNALLDITSVHDSKGNLVQYRGLILDITDQKSSQAALQRERDFNDGILNHTQSVILVLDSSGHIAYVNHRAADLGYTADALLGMPLARLVHDAHRPVFQDALRTVLDNGMVQRLDLPFVGKSGNSTQFAVHLSSMREGHGDDRNAIVVLTDVTESSLLQSKLGRSEKMAALGQLVSSVAHEVNNPLASIIGFTELVLEKPDIPELARQELRIILQEAERTRLIVQNMLRFAREMPPQREPVQINSILRQIVESRSYGLTDRNVEIVERLAEDLPVIVADPHQIAQVFLNILNNAFDAIEQVEGRGRIQVETSFTPETVEIRFLDNGPGISNLEHIFEPFFTTKPAGKGTGLGLSICHAVVEEHLGEIRCFNNSEGGGCTVLIQLPVATIHAQPVASADVRARDRSGVSR